MVKCRVPSSAVVTFLAPMFYVFFGNRTLLGIEKRRLEDSPGEFLQENSQAIFTNQVSKFFFRTKEVIYFLKSSIIESLEIKFGRPKSGLLFSTTQIINYCLAIFIFALLLRHHVTYNCRLASFLDDMVRRLYSVCN